MCLILFGWQAHPEFALVVAANRDEFYWRSTEALHQWDGEPDLFAGRDSSGGGTWLGVTEQGRFAAVTNVRSGLRQRGPAPVESRGRLPVDFLRSEARPEPYAAAAHKVGHKYGGFNLISSDLQDMWWASNRSPESPRRVKPGIHGLSNAALDTPWQKVTRGKSAFRTALAADDGSESALDAYFEFLHDESYAPRSALPKTGVGLVPEKLLSAAFVRMGFYGTRSSTVLRVRHDGSFDVTERRFGLFGRTGDTRLTAERKW